MLTNKTSTNLLLVALVALLLVGSLSGRLLLLLLVFGLGTGGLGQGLLKNLEDLLISDLLISLERFEVWCFWCSELCETVLGDGWLCVSSDFVKL